MARSRSVWALAIAFAFMSAGCDSRDAASTESRSEQTTPSSSTTPKNGETSSPPRIAGDGRYFGYIRAADADAEPATVSFDIAQFFYGDAAQKAAEEDGVVKPGEPVSNDHYERNPTTRAEELELASDTRVTAAPPASFLMQSTTRKARAECEASTLICTQVPLSLNAFFRALKERDVRRGIPVWVTIHDGVVARIDEQYFP